MCLTAHFIDDNWKYHKRIINFKPILSHKGADIAGALLECIEEWGIERVMAITMDNASSNDAAAGILKTKLSSLICHGKYLHVRCVAHIINLIVQDGMKVQNYIIDSIRNAVRYIRALPNRLDTFKECVVDSKIETNGLLSLNVSTRWNSTYDMLERAIQLEKAIALYALKDSSFRNDAPGCSQWNFAKKMAAILELFKQKTIDLSCSNYVIAHEVYAEVRDIGDNLGQMFNEKGQHYEFLDMIAQMKYKFEKYYEDDGGKSNKLFEFASILDPRVKLTMIEYSCVKSCEVMQKSGLLKTDDVFKQKVEEMVDEVKSEMKVLIKEYEDLEPTDSSVPVTSTRDRAEQGRAKKTWMGKLEQFRGGIGQSSSQRTELDRYLLEDRELMSDKFDILNWWKVNSTRYPTLARMAKDIMAIPVSTVASESAFSTGGRVVHSYRSSLSPTIVEALICTQDWIRKGRKDINEDEEYENSMS